MTRLIHASLTTCNGEATRQKVSGLDHIGQRLTRMRALTAWHPAPLTLRSLAPQVLFEPH